MYYFIFLLLSPLIEVLSNHPPNFKFLTPLGDSSSHIFVTHLIFSSPTYFCCTFSLAEVARYECSPPGGVWNSLNGTVTFRNQLYLLFGVKCFICFSHCAKQKIPLTCSRGQEGYFSCSELIQLSRNIPGFHI